MASRNTHRPQDTRMQRDEAQARQEAEQQRRAGEVTMATAKDAADNREGLWDPHDGELIESGLAPEREDEMRRRAQLSDDPDAIVEPEDSVVRVPLGDSMQPPVGPSGIPYDEERASRAGDEIIEPTMVDESQQPDPEAEQVAAALAFLRERGMLPAADERALGPEALDPAPGVRTVQRMVPAAERMVVFRSAADVEPTIGQGPNNRWKFVKGKRYKVPQHIADHMDEKGLVASWG